MSILRLTRQQIYDRIKAGSKDSYILQEMKNLGFWDAEQPTVSEDLIKREAEVSKELTELQRLDRRFKNQEALIADMRKDRMKKAKEKREQTRAANKQKKLDKAARWKLLQEKQIIYLGKEVSYGLSNTESDISTLNKYGLPVFRDVIELAENMEVTLADIRYLLYHRKVSKKSNYHTFTIPKKSGGVRTISAPKGKLKRLQHWVLNNVLNVILFDEHAHGFITGKSICTNATPHIGKDIVINIDLKNFFPTITYKRVKGLFSKLGYSEQIATIFALICTETPYDKVEMDGVEYFVQKAERVLPQGSPASPAISNLIAFRLDKKIEGLAAKYDFTYTRYADDLSFSTSANNDKQIARLLFFLEKIIASEGLTINTEKTTIMRKGRQQRVTGIVVNEKLNIPREDMRRFRALLHNISVNGWKNQKWKGTQALAQSIKGYISFVKMVNPQRGLQFENTLAQIIDKYGFPSTEKATESIPENIEIKKETTKEEKPSVDENKKDQSTNGDNWWNIL